MSGLSQMSGSSRKATIAETAIGKSRFAGNAARNWAIGWTRRARRGRMPTPTPIGTQIRLAIAMSTRTRSRVTRPSRTACRPRRPTAPEDEAADLPQRRQRHGEHDGRPQASRPNPASAVPRAWRCLAARAAADRMRRHTAARGRRWPRRRANGAARRAPRIGRRHARLLLEAEAVGPGHQRAEQQLVVDQDHHEHGHDRPADRGEVLRCSIASAM